MRTCELEGTYVEQVLPGRRSLSWFEVRQVLKDAEVVDHHLEDLVRGELIEVWHVDHSDLAVEEHLCNAAVNNIERPRTYLLLASQDILDELHRALGDVRQVVLALLAQDVVDVELALHLGPQRTP